MTGAQSSDFQWYYVVHEGKLVLLPRPPDAEIRAAATFKPGDLVERCDDFLADVFPPIKRTVLRVDGWLVTIKQEGLYPEPVERTIPACNLRLVDAPNKTGEARMSERVTLAPCPFCGGEAFLIAMKGDPSHPTAKADLHRPQCMNCGSNCGGFHTKAGAIAAWNRRAALSTHAGTGEVEDTYTDEEGRVWNRPTAYAYAAACKALWRHATAALPPSSGWQPIETAPRDGTPIIGWADGYEWPFEARWIEDDQGVFGWFDAYYERADPDPKNAHRLTHWRPLPPPPSSEGA